MAARRGVEHDAPRIGRGKKLNALCLGQGTGGAVLPGHAAIGIAHDGEIAHEAVIAEIALIAEIAVERAGFGAHH